MRVCEGEYVGDERASEFMCVRRKTEVVPEKDRRKSLLEIEKAESHTVCELRFFTGGPQSQSQSEDSSQLLSINLPYFFLCMSLPAVSSK